MMTTTGHVQEIEGARIYVNYTEGSPDKPVVFYLHGDNQNASAGYHITKPFAERGHTIVAFDRPGHGRSGPYSVGFTLDRLTRTLDKDLVIITTDI